MAGREGVDVKAGGRSWLISAVVAVATLAGLVELFHLTSTEEAAARPGERAKVAMPAVTLARGGDELLSEEAAMRDPTPLFLPTRFNATEEAFVAGTRRELSSAFQGFEPKLKYAENALALRWPAVVEVPGRVAEVFARDNPAWTFAGFGQKSDGVAPLSPRTAFIEVVSAADGGLIFARALSDARPPGEGGWQPMQFLVAVDPAGMVGPAVLTQSSTVAAIDGYFEGYLRDVLRIGERLGPGFYRIGIGP